MPFMQILKDGIRAFLHVCSPHAHHTLSKKNLEKRQKQISPTGQHCARWQICQERALAEDNIVTNYIEESCPFFEEILDQLGLHIISES
jgi:hypothetical protein